MRGMYRDYLVFWKDERFEVEQQDVFHCMESAQEAADKCREENRDYLERVTAVFRDDGPCWGLCTNWD